MNWRGGVQSRRAAYWYPPLANPRAGAWWLFTVPRRVWDREKRVRHYTLPFVAVGSGNPPAAGLPAGKTVAQFLVMEHDWMCTGIAAQVLDGQSFGVTNPQQTNWGQVQQTVTNVYLAIAGPQGEWFPYKAVPLENVAGWTPTWGGVGPQFVAAGETVAVTLLNANSFTSYNVLLVLAGVEVE